MSQVEDIRLEMKRMRIQTICVAVFAVSLWVAILIAISALSLKIEREGLGNIVHKVWCGRFGCK